ncbi:MAG TPA: ChbG/HpnK family deacetylase, partial [Actinomycetota bacterium]|nr:ChbG/HpnK family deacetylase [Actinomycetota bacterium]
MDGRALIVNADDFGQGQGVNRGVIRAFEEGILTSASAMVRWPAASEAAAYARAHPSLGVGLHVDLGEWAYRRGEWVPLYEVVPMKPDPVRLEVERQVARFRELFGTNPTHLDSHQHVHRDEPVRSELWNLAAELGVPLRMFNPRIRYCGDFYGVDPRGNP